MGEQILVAPAITTRQKCLQGNACKEIHFNS